MIYRCPQCLISFPMEDHEWPLLQCQCGHHSATGSDSAPLTPALEEFWRQRGLGIHLLPKPRPGDKMTELFESFGVTKIAGCDCEDKARLMNIWGADCAKRRPEIVGWLKMAAENRGWWTTLRTAPQLLVQLWFSPLDPFGSIVDEAMRRANDEYEKRLLERKQDGISDLN